MKKCLIIGGGFAGLSAAAFLSNKNINVELIEASPKLGGRAFSIKDNTTGDYIDNGQHILMGCYKDTLEFINLINANKHFMFQKNLEVNFVRENFEIYKLKASSLPYPFNLLAGFLKFKAISIHERFQIIRFFLRIYFYSDSFLEKLNVNQWLHIEEQDETVRKSFWEIISVGALNCSTINASAKIFSDILKKIFFKGKKAATIILPKEDLSSSFCNNAKIFIENKGGKINFLEAADELVFRAGKIEEVITNKRRISDFDFVISAIPFYALKKALKENNFFEDLYYDYSSILNIHLWMKENDLKERFYGLIGSDVHWVFNNGKHITVTISDADRFNSLQYEEIIKLVGDEIFKYLKLSKDKITHYRIIREKRATFIPSNKIINKRPDSNTRYQNFLLAGDWTNTGLPATIEGAVKSGKIASEQILKFV
jgi:squalene-associated FAD-dependent desaturase